jgi:hypothetical protein
MNQEFKTQINGISRDEFLENIIVAATEIVDELAALKKPNSIALLRQEVTGSPIITDEFKTAEYADKVYRKNGFEILATYAAIDENTFQLTITKGLGKNPYRDSSEPKLNDFYLFGLICPFGRFHGYIQKGSANGSHEQDSWKGDFLEI